VSDSINPQNAIKANSSLNVAAVWRRDLCNINKTRDNHLARYGEHFNYTLFVRTDRLINSNIGSFGAKIVRLKTLRFGFIGFWFSVLLSIRSLDKKLGLDAVILPIGEELLVPMVKLLLKRSKTKIILDLWDVPGLALEGTDKNLVKKIVRKLYLTLLPVCLKNADIVIAGVCPEPLLSLGVSESNLILSENGLVKEVFKPSTPASKCWEQLDTSNEECIKLLYQGFVHEARGTSAMLELVRDLRISESIDVRLLLVGPGDKGIGRVINEKAIQFGISGFVKYIGSVDSAEIPSIIAGADICLCPLEDREKFRWSYPVKIYEYMAMGKPVVASDLPGTRRVVGNDLAKNCLYDPVNEFSFKDMVKRLSVDSDLRNYVSLSSVDRMADKDWCRLVEKIADEIVTRMLFVNTR